ncbi:phage major tail tube protein [Orbus mooreae]|uniref:phage major tail tube protein n=1 Tax=Orbus mooreae TaxID=3074107 RepID=UPI00370D5063
MHANILFNVYKDGYRKAGVAQVDLPSLNAITAELKGAGIAGALDLPIKGLFQAFGVTLNFRTITSDYASLLTPEAQHIELWSAVQDPDSATGALNAKQHKFILRCVPKNQTVGKLSVGEAQDRTLEFELTYYREIYDGNDVIEIDKLNNIYRIAGVDQNSDIREAIGDI